MEEGQSDDCNVKVAVHIRPLIRDERSQGCEECVAVVSGKPQVIYHPNIITIFMFCVFILSSGLACINILSGLQFTDLNTLV